MEKETEHTYVPLPSNFPQEWQQNLEIPSSYAEWKEKLLLLLIFFVKNVIYAKVLPSKWAITGFGQAIQLSLKGVTDFHLTEKAEVLPFLPSLPYLLFHIE